MPTKVNIKPNAYSYPELLHNGASYLGKWFPKQKAKGARSAFTSAPSENAKARMRQCLAGCIAIDCLEKNVEIDDTRLTNPLKRKPYLKELFKEFEASSTASPTRTSSFKRIFFNTFGTPLYTEGDIYGLIAHKETAECLAFRGFPPRLWQKIQVLDRKIAMIKDTQTIIEGLKKNGVRFNQLIVHPGGKSVRDPWFQNNSRIYYLGCLEFLDTPKPSDITAGIEVGTAVKSKYDKAKKSFMAAAQCCGITKFAIEREIIFDNAKVTFKSSTTFGAQAIAKAKGNLATEESAANERAEGKPTTYAQGSAELTVQFGLTAKASAALESNAGDLSIEGEAFVGVKATASAQGSIRATGAGAGFNFEAFAGAKAEVTGTSVIKIFGLPVMKQKVKAAIAAGVGAQAGVNFDVDILEGVSAGCSFGLVLGTGGAVGTETTVNHYNLVLSAQRGQEEILNYMHNRALRANHYQRMSHGDKGADVKDCARMLADLKKRLVKLEQERTRLAKQERYG